jgi:hypothetical protein
MAVISAGTTTTTALVQTGDTTGNLVIKTGSSGTTALTVSGADQSVTFAGAVNVSSSAFALGSVSAPSITFTGDTNTGIYSPAADTIAFTEGGVESMRITSAGDVGIGTATPVSQLHLVSASDSGLTIYKSAVGAGNVRVVSQGGGSALTFGSDQSTGTTERMRIDSSGNVGIGTSSPSAKLHVSTGTTYTNLLFKSESANTTILRLAVDGDGPYFFQSAATSEFKMANQFSSGYLTFSTGSAGAERMRIDSSGNVGIGTSSPTAGGKLDVNGIAYFGTGDKVRIYSNNVLQGAGTLDIGTIGSAALIFNTANTERMRIDSSGNLLVGTTTVSGSKLTVNNTGSGGIAVNQSSAGGYSLASNAVSLAGTYYHAQWLQSGTPVGSITSTGSTTSYTTSSDYRLKENIAPMTGALSKVSALKPVTYTWKSSGEESQGFIAHELAEVCPEAVNGEKDAVNEDGSIKPQGIDTSFLVATLTAAIQELNAKVTALEAQLENK